MKVNFNNTQNYVYAYELMVGSTFTAKRSGVDEVGLYIKIDKNSGVFLSRYREKNVMAVNLATGQVRAFAEDVKVIPVNAEVDVLE